MIISTTSTEVEGNLKFDEVVQMRLDDNANALIIRTLTTLYSDPYKSSLREYTSNAFDSHRLAGQTRPVEVSLPSTLSPNLVVQDWGVGLDREELKAFGQYGATTKRTTNDQIGGFGLGSKSGLAIASQFTVTAVKNGKKNTVVIGFDTDGGPIMQMMNEKDTEEGNGVKITIPTSEVQKFQNAVNSGLFLGWPEGSIRVNGQAPLSVFNKSDWEPLGKDAGWIAADKRSPEYADAYYCWAVVGPVYYKFSWSDALPNLDSRLAQGYLSKVLLNLPIGSVDLTPSRESLTFSARTRQTIQDHVDAAVAEARQSYLTRVEHAPNIRTALRLSRESEKNGFGADYTYQGIPLSVPGTPTNVVHTAVRPEDIGDTNSIGRAVFRNERSVSRFNSYDLMIAMGLGLGARSGKTILVTDLANPHVQKGYSDYHPASISKDATHYLRATQPDDASMHGYTFYFTNEPMSTLPEAVVAAFDEVIPETEYAATADVGRRDFSRQVRQAAAKNRSSSPRLKFEAGQVDVLHPSLRTTRVAIDALDTAVRYIVLRNQSDVASEVTMRSALTTKRGQFNGRRSRETGLFLLKTGYRFILVNKSFNVSKLSNIVTVVSIEKALEETVRNAFRGLSASDAEVARQRENHSYYSWVKQIDPANIKNSDTRKWMKRLTDETISAKYNEYVKAYNSARDYGVDVEKLKSYTFASVSSAENRFLRYPLLNGWSSNGKCRDWENYINLVDAAR